MTIEHLMKEIDLVVTEKEFASSDQIKLIALLETSIRQISYARKTIEILRNKISAKNVN